jgi:hypothetical protein
MQTFVLSTRIHHAARRRHGGVAAGGARGAAGGAGDWVSHARIGRVVVAPCARFGKENKQPASAISRNPQISGRRFRAAASAMPAR